MAVRLESIRALAKLIGPRDAEVVHKLAKKQDQIEARWIGIFQKQIQSITDELVKNAQNTGHLKTSAVDFTDTVMRHSYEVTLESIKGAQRPYIPYRVRLAKAPPKAKMPRSLLELRRWWDRYRKQGYVPARQKVIAEKLKQRYLKKVQSVWDRYGEEFRAGETASTSKPVIKIYEAARVSESRAKMIVETETTYYYNKARRDVYDESEDITHYLFVAIRDHATTKWCKTRDKLVYKKGDPILDTETPPIHWNCRSEILPLTPLNPNHLRLIKDKSRAREHHHPAALPPGWGARAA